MHNVYIMLVVHVQWCVKVLLVAGIITNRLGIPSVIILSL